MLVVVYNVVFMARQSSEYVPLLPLDCYVACNIQVVQQQRHWNHKLLTAERLYMLIHGYARQLKLVVKGSKAQCMAAS